MQRRGVTIEEVEEALKNFKSRRLQIEEGKPDRIGVMGRNKITVIHTPDSNQIVTVYKFNSAYNESKHKHRRNKNRRRRKNKLKKYN